MAPGIGTLDFSTGILFHKSSINKIFSSGLIQQFGERNLSTRGIFTDPFLSFTDNFLKYTEETFFIWKVSLDLQVFLKGYVLN